MRVLFLAMIVIALVALLWFLLSFMFKPVGKLGYRIYKDAKDEIINKNPNENEQEN